MKICFVGLGPELREQCRLALREFGGEGCDLIAGPLDSEHLDADAYIREFDPESLIDGINPEELTRTLFVIEPRLLERFRERLNTQRASIVLKPVRPGALRPFFEHSVRQHQPLPNAEPARAANSEVDDLLNGLLHAELKLREYGKTPADLLARAAYDLQAPVTALSGYCGLMEAQRLGPLNTAQVDTLSRMQHSIKRVSRLADAMLELSAGRSTKTRPDLQQADIEACISQAVHEVTPHAEQKQIRFTVSVEYPERRLTFDSAKLEQALANLLEHACKFTATHGTIEVSGYPVFWYGRTTCIPARAALSEEQPVANQIPNAYRIDVKGSWNGNASEHIESIFHEHAFYSGTADRSAEGLGLAICRMIVEQHAGNIWVESAPAGRKFSFVLPRSISASPRKAEAVTAAASVGASALSA